MSEFLKLLFLFGIVYLRERIQGLNSTVIISWKFWDQQGNLYLELWANTYFYIKNSEAVSQYQAVPGRLGTKTETGR